MENNQHSTDLYNHLSQVIKNLYNYALLLTQNPDLAEKLVYDAVRQVLNHPNPPEEVSDLYYLLCRTLESFFVKGYRPCGNHGEVHLKWDEVQLGIPDEIRLSRVYDLKHLNRILSLLTEKTRILFCLWQTRCPYGRIADWMQVREGTVKKQIFLIRKVLRQAQAD